MAINFKAIQIDTDDELGNEVYNSTIQEDHTRLSVKGSLQKLIPPETAHSIHSSVHSSLKSRLETLNLIDFSLLSKLICFKIVDGIKAFLMDTKFLWITILFSVAGGLCFMWLEADQDLFNKERALERHLMAREMLLFKSVLLNFTDCIKITRYLIRKIEVMKAYMRCND